MYKIWECTVMPLNLKCVNSASRGVRILLAVGVPFGVGARSPLNSSRYCNLAFCTF